MSAASFGVTKASCGVGAFHLAAKAARAREESQEEHNPVQQRNIASASEAPVFGSAYNEAAGVNFAISGSEQNNEEVQF